MFPVTTFGAPAENPLQPGRHRQKRGSEPNHSLPPEKRMLCRQRRTRQVRLGKKTATQWGRAMFAKKPPQTNDRRRRHGGPDRIQTDNPHYVKRQIKTSLYNFKLLAVRSTRFLFLPAVFYHSLTSLFLRVPHCSVAENVVKKYPPSFTDRFRSVKGGRLF